MSRPSLGLLDPSALVRAPGRALRRARDLLGPDPRHTLSRLATLARHRRAYRQLHHDLVDFRILLALVLARRVGLLEALAPAPLPAKLLATRCGITPGAAETLLHVLVAQGSVRAHPDGYALTGFGQAFLTDDGPLTLAPVVDLVGGFAARLDALEQAVRTGERCPDLDVQQDHAADAFLDAVNAYLDLAGRELLARVELPAVRRFIVGSMGVSFSALVLRREPAARVTYGCLEHLVARIPRLSNRYRIDPARVDGMHRHAGEPEGDRWGEGAFDLVLLTKKMVLAPEQRLGERFARKALQVLRPGGAAVLWEAVHPDGGPLGRSLAAETLLDLGVSPTSGPQTWSAMSRMLGDIGFRRAERIPCLGGETTFVVAWKG